MPDELVIAPATLADVDAIHAIEEASFPAPWRREFFVGEIQAPGRFILVAKSAETVVGYMFAMWIFEEMHVNKIAVIESERRCGIAAALMERCLRFAREHDIDSISLEVRKSNSGAQDFYRQLDFKPTHTRRRYYPDGEAAVVMVRQLK